MLPRLLLCLSTLLLHLPALRWLVGGGTADPSRALVVGLGLLIATVLVRGDVSRWLGWSGAHDNEPPARWGPLGLVLLSAVPAGLGPLILLPSTVTAMFLGMALWGLLGLWLPAGRWWRSVPYAIVLGGLVPVGGIADMTLGFPLRVATAELVSAGLGPLLDTLGTAAPGADRLLAVDRPTTGTLASVDAPCAGLRSVWAAGLMLAAATLIQGRGLDTRGVLAFGVVGTVIPLLNAARVAVLALLLALDLPAVGAILHVPMGVVVFVVGTGLALFVLGQAPTPPARTPPGDSQGRWPGPLRHAPILGVAALSVGLACLPAGTSAPRPVQLPLDVPETWRSITPDPEEIASATRGADLAGAPPPLAKFALPVAEGDSRPGSVLVLPTQDWRVHHLPSQCLHAMGLVPGAPMLYTVSPELIVAGVAVLEPGRPVGRLYWWYQTRTQQTPDLAARVWSSWTRAPETWVLVAVHYPEGPLPAALLLDLQRRIADALDRPLHAHHVGPSPSAPQEL